MQNITNTIICNQALGKLGANRINDLDSDTTTEAILCRDHFEELRDTLLEEGRWTFARRSYISDQAGRVAGTWKYKWKYPIDQNILIVFRVYSDPSMLDYEQAAWEREENYILTDLDTFYYDTLVRIEDPRKFTTSFRQVLIYRLALELCMAITENLKLFDSLSKEYQIRLNDALAIDGMQGRNERIQSNKLIQARSGSGYLGG
jgi:hypothetical protein